MKNVEFTVTPDDRLLVEVDLTKSFGPSTTGRSTIVAQTDSPRFEKFDHNGTTYQMSIVVIKK